MPVRTASSADVALDQLHLLRDSETPLVADLMDGHPLRYRLNTDGTYVLYSVGDNLIDDGGSSILESPGSGGQKSPWSARDCVWPSLEVGNKAGGIVKAH